jgi:hypothetical protein
LAIGCRIAEFSCLNALPPSGGRKILVMHPGARPANRDFYRGHGLVSRRRFSRATLAGMINWQELADRLDAEAQGMAGACFAEIELHPGSTLDEIEAVLCAEEERVRPEVDSAARAFAGGQPWPALSEEGQAFLQTRLFYAYTLAATFAWTGTRPVKVDLEEAAWADDEEATLVWLLNECWPTLGVVRWMEGQLEAYGALLPDEEDDV